MSSRQIVPIKFNFAKSKENESETSACPNSTMLVSLNKNAHTINLFDPEQSNVSMLNSNMKFLEEG